MLRVARPSVVINAIIGKFCRWGFGESGKLAIIAALAPHPGSHRIRITISELATKLYLHVRDGWFYFIHGWTRVMAEMFHVDIPATGPGFDRLCEIAESIPT